MAMVVLADHDSAMVCPRIRAHVTATQITSTKSSLLLRQYPWQMLGGSLGKKAL